MSGKRRSAVLSSEEEEDRGSFRETCHGKRHVSSGDNSDEDRTVKTRRRRKCLSKSDSSEINDKSNSDSVSSIDERVLSARAGRSRNGRKRRGARLSSSSSSAEERRETRDTSNSDDDSDTGFTNSTTPALRTHRARRKVTSKDKKQKQRELQRLQRIRQRQSNKKAQRRLEQAENKEVLVKVESDSSERDADENKSTIDTDNDVVILSTNTEHWSKESANSMLQTSPKTEHWSKEGANNMHRTNKPELSRKTEHWSKESENTMLQTSRNTVHWSKESENTMLQTSKNTVHWSKESANTIHQTSRNTEQWSKESANTMHQTNKPEMNAGILGDIDLSCVQGTSDTLTGSELDHLKAVVEVFPSTSNVPDCDISICETQHSVDKYIGLHTSEVRSDEIQRNNDGPKQSNGIHVVGVQRTEDGTNSNDVDSSDSDILMCHTQKKVRKLCVDSEEDSKSDKSESKDEESDVITLEDDDEDEMEDFIVDDDEELEHVSSDGILTEDSESQGVDTVNRQSPMKFLVEKDLLLLNGNVPCVWLKEGKQLRKYELRESEKQGENKEVDEEGAEETEDEEDLPGIYERTDKICPYNMKMKHKYQAIHTIPLDNSEGKASGSHNNGDITTVEVISWDIMSEDDSSPQLMPDTFGYISGGLRGAFEVYLQALLSNALETDFLVDIYAEKDAYFLPALHKVDNFIEDTKYFLVKSQAWSPRFKKAIEKYPMIEVLDESFENFGPCQACILKDRTGTKMVRLWGTPYSKNTLEDINTEDDTDSESESETDIELSSDSESGQHYHRIRGKEFIVGRFCANRSTLYHRLHHFKLALFKEYQNLVEYHRLVRQKMRNNDIIDIVLGNTYWVETVFSALESLQDQACKYTSDGKHFAPTFS